MRELNAIKKEEMLAGIRYFVDKGGPCKGEYAELTESIDQLAVLIKEEALLPEEVKEILDVCSFVQDTSSVMGHIRLKPYGYAGDFDIIDRIYREDAGIHEFSQWDHFALQHAAAVAVRNRKRYFLDLVVSRVAQGPVALCNIASGPGRDLLEAYEQIANKADLKTTCVEMEPKAIGYASQLTACYNEHIRFVERNVFRFHADQQYDLVWSAGLFDYFDDSMFKLLLQRFYSWLKPGAEIVIGNFNEAHNPSRDFMEIFGEWRLKHRSEEQLIHLALEAGFSLEQLSVGREPENVNLFLHIRKD